MRDCGKGQIDTDSQVVPTLASSSALSFPHSPECAAIHRSSTLLLAAMRSIAAMHSIAVLLRRVCDLMVRRDDRQVSLYIMCVTEQLPN